MGTATRTASDRAVRRVASAARSLRGRRVLAARQRLLSFVLSTFPGYRVNWHHELLCDYLEAFVALEIPRLIVSMPPRSGKSELVSRRLPAWILGRDPDARVIGASYTSRLATENSRQVKRIIAEPSYREVFPDTRLGSAVVTNSRVEAKNTSDQWEVVGRQGGYIGTGVGGSITGFGARYLILDDLVKGRKTAESRSQMDDLWSWVRDDILTRGEEPFGVLVTATRWGIDDPTGRFLREEPEKWAVLELPAVREAEGNDLDPREVGEPLWPEWFAGLRTPEDQVPPREQLVALANARYEEIRSRNPYGWAGLFQQRPVPKEGNIIKHAWTTNRYTVLPEGPGDWIQSWDAKAGSKDPRSSLVAGQVWFRPRRPMSGLGGGGAGAQFYLVDRVHGLWNVSETMAQIRAVSSRWPFAVAKLVEAKADGAAIKDLLDAEIPGIVSVAPRGSKEFRCEAVSAYWQAGNVWLPDRSIAPWVDEFVAEVVDFPGAPHDDEVDAMTQALLHWTGRPVVSQGLDAGHLDGEAVASRSPAFGDIGAGRSLEALLVYGGDCDRGGTFDNF